MIDIHAQLPRTGQDESPLESEAMGINSHHQVVGWHLPDEPSSVRSAFIWLPDDETINATGEGNYVPLYIWLLNEGHTELANQLAIETGLIE